MNEEVNIVPLTNGFRRNLRFGILATAAIFACATHADSFSPIEILDDVPPSLPHVARIVKVTEGPAHHFFGYYGMVPWDASGENLVCMESDFGDRMVEAGEEARIVLNNLKDGSARVVSTTKAWNFQQGSLLHWLPSAPDRLIIHNDLVDGAFRAVIVDVTTGERRALPRAVAAVAPNGEQIASISYARLRDTRPGYGYAGLSDPYADEMHPAEDGLYVVDIKSGKDTLIASLDAVYNAYPLPEEVSHKKMWLNHVLYSRDSQRIFFMARVKDADDRNVTAAFTVSPDGSDLRCVLPYSWGASHFDWVNGTQLVVTTKYQAHTPWLHVLFTDGKEDYTPLAAESINQDGHCHASYDEKWMVSDSYPQGTNRMRDLYIMNMESQELACVARFHEAPAYSGPWRCDLHPRWSRDGTKICIDSTNDGSRQVYVVELAYPDKAAQG